MQQPVKNEIPSDCETYGIGKALVKKAEVKSDRDGLPSEAKRSSESTRAPATGTVTRASVSADVKEPLEGHSSSSSSSSQMAMVTTNALPGQHAEDQGVSVKTPLGSKRPGPAPFGISAPGKRHKVDGQEPHNLSGPPHIDEMEFTKDELDHLMKAKKKTVRCSATTEALVNAEIRASRPRSIQEEKHLLVLLKDMQLVQPLGEVSCICSTYLWICSGLLDLWAGL